MKARDAVSPVERKVSEPPVGRIGGGVHLLEVLPRLLEAPDRRLGVSDDNGSWGVITEDSCLEALGRQIAPRYDCSVIEISCAPSDYSASHIARAVEDSDVHLVDMLTNPGEGGRLNVTLRVRCEDPLATVHSLERYGYEVTDVFAHDGVVTTAAVERLLGLQALINV